MTLHYYMKYCILFILYPLAFSSSELRWCNLRDCFCTKKSAVTRSDDSKLTNECPYNKDDKEKCVAEQPTSESSITQKQNLEYNDYFKIMFANITINLKSKVELDSLMYERYTSYKSEMFDHPELKKLKGYYMYERGLYLLKHYEYRKADFEIDSKQRINFVKMLTKEVTKDVLNSAPEIVGMSFKFIEILNRLSDEEFIASLLQLDFCINLMKEEQKGQIYKDFLEELSKSESKIKDHISMCIYKPNCEMYKTLYKVDDLFFSDLEFRRYNVRRLSEDVNAGLNAIYFLLSPTHTLNIYTKLMKLELKLEDEIDEFDFLIIAQCSKLLVDFFPDIFGCELKLNVDKKIFQIKKPKTEGLIDLLKLLKASINNSILNK